VSNNDIRGAIVSVPLRSHFIAFGMPSLTRLAAIPGLLVALPSSKAVAMSKPRLLVFLGRSVLFYRLWSVVGAITPR